MAYTTPQMCSVWVKDAGNPPSFTVRGTTPKKATQREHNLRHRSSFPRNLFKWLLNKKKSMKSANRLQDKRHQLHCE